MAMKNSFISIIIVVNIFFAVILIITPISIFSFVLFFVIGGGIIFLGWQCKNMQKQICFFKLLLESEEFCSQIYTSDSKLARYLIDDGNYLGTKNFFDCKGTVQCFYKNLFIVLLRSLPEKKILRSLNCIARSLLFNTRVEVRNALNLALVVIESERLILACVCADAIIQADEERCPYIEMVDLVIMAFYNTQSESDFVKFAACIDRLVDYRASKLPEFQRNNINNFKVMSRKIWL